MAEATDALESVITDAMRAEIGVAGESVTYEVTSTGVRMFARAVGYEDPVYYDRAEAQRRGLRDLPAPPGYLGTPVFDPVTCDPTSGAPPQAYARVPSPYTLMLNGGTDVEYMGAPICAGDVLTGSSQLESLSERYSQALGGPMLIQVNAATYRNEAGDVVAVMRGTDISYGTLRKGG